VKAIITYHSIDESGSVISIDARTFRSHVEWLARCRLPVVSVAELARLPDDASAIALTFDDGFANFGQVAWPLLRQHGLSATLFVVTECIGATNAWSVGQQPPVPHLPLLGWSELGRLASEGVTIGSHTRTHPNLKQISEQQAADEIGGAAQVLSERLGARAEIFAYPYGAFSPGSVRAVRRHHAFACTTELRGVRASDDAHELPRLDAYYFRRAGVLEAFGSARFRNYLWLRARARGLRQALYSGAR